MPGCHDVHRLRAVEHQAQAGVAQALEVDAAQAGPLAQAVELIRVLLMPHRLAVLADRDQPFVAPPDAQCHRLALLCCLERPQRGDQIGGHRQIAP